MFGVKNLGKLYNKYDEEKKYRKKIKARELWLEILTSQIETGNPYLLYKDHVIQSQISKIWGQSNLLICVLKLLNIQVQKKLLYVIWHQFH